MIKELKILNEIANLSGQGSNKSKIELLINNNSEIMQYLLQIAFNPFKTTKLNKLDITFNNINDIEDLDYFNKYKNIIEKLFNLKAANNEIREEIITLIDQLPTDNIQLKETLVKITTKNLNIGIGIKSINKAFGKDFLPDLSLMLADDDVSDIINWKEIHTEIKYDGIRCLAIYNKEQKYFKFITRAFNELNCLCLQNISIPLLEIAEKYDLPNNCFFDGELTDINRKSVSGKINKILSDTAQHGIDKDIVFNIFDHEDYSIITDKINGITPYVERRNKLIDLLKDCTSINIKLGESQILNNMEEVQLLFKEIVIQGGEGLICKDPNHIYEPKRSNSWIKIKEVNECDLLIIGYYPGSGKRLEKNQIGGFICQSKCGKLVVNIGGGFEDSQLDEISKNPLSYTGKIISVLYNVKIQDKNGNYSLFLPRASEIRFDKLEADELDKIK